MKKSKKFALIVLGSVLVTVIGGVIAIGIWEFGADQEAAIEVIDLSSRLMNGK